MGYRITGEREGGDNGKNIFIQLKNVAQNSPSYCCSNDIVRETEGERDT